MGDEHNLLSYNNDSYRVGCEYYCEHFLGSVERSDWCRRWHCCLVADLQCDYYEYLLCACYLIDITRFWKSFFGMTIRFVLPLGLTTRFMSLTGLTGKLALFVYAGVYVV